MRMQLVSTGAAGLLTVIALLLLPDMPDGFAQPTQQARAAAPLTLAFNIPSEPLGDALEAYSAETGIDVLSADGVVAGRRSAGVAGVYNPATALQLLLENSGLAAHYIDTGAFTLVPAAAPAAADPARFSAYAATLQQALNQTLCSDPDIVSGSLRVVLRFWIGPTGVIRHPVLLDGTGDQNWDATLLALLDGMDIGQAPPIDLPQPATVLIVQLPPGIPGGCSATGNKDRSP